MPRFEFVVVALLFLVGCRSGSTKDRPPQNFPSTGDLVANFLAEYNLASSASLVYQGRCENYEVVDRSAPRMRVKGTDDALVALHEIFADDPHMQITREPSGMVRMYDEDVRRDLLDHRFDRITIQRQGVPSVALAVPNEVLWGILESPEVNAYLEARSIHRPGAPGTFRWIEFVVPEGGPTMPADLKNVTLAQALDGVMQTFRPGLWVYKECGDHFWARRIVALEYCTIFPFRHATWRPNGGT